MTLDDMVAKYMQLREMKAELKKRYQVKAERIDEGMNRIEAEILKRFTEQGIQSSKTAHGTPYIQLRESVTVADRDIFFQEAINSGALEWLEARANKTAVLQYKEAHGELPPGLNYRAERVVNIRSK